MLLRHFLGAKVLENEPTLVISQALVLLIVLFFFFLGLVMKGWIDHDGKMSLKQFVAFLVTGFLLLGIPLCSAVYEALIATGNDLYVALSALVPPFFAGFTSKREISKLVK